MRPGWAHWNFPAGAYHGYNDPERYPANIGEVQKGVESFGTSLVGLVDTHRWHEVYTEDDLRELFGYPQVYCASLNAADANTGLTLLGDGCILECKPVRLHDRDCLRAKVKLNGRITHVYLVYLTSFSGYRRLLQMRALVADIRTLGKGAPVAVIGDCNTERPERVGSLARALGRLRRQPLSIPGNLAWLAEAYELVHTEAVTVLREAGFCDYLRDNPRSTFRKRIWGVWFGAAVDYSFGYNLYIRSCQILEGQLYSKSDHWPVVTLL